MTRAVRITSHVSLVAALAAVFTVVACSGAGNKGDGFGDPDANADGAGGSSGSSGGPGGGLDATLGGDLDGGSRGGRGDGSLFNDATPDVASDGCVPGEAGPPPFPQRCTGATNNECDGVTDTTLTSLGVSSALLNGAQGNGFDDDCDGLVDEGCTCPGSGNTKTCYLVPATQIDPATKAAVGWCTTNAKGSLDCAGNEFPKWSGACRGAQPPYRHDICAIGDFNCDGLEENSDIQDCQCKVGVVQCPTAALTYAPYPDKANLPLLDATQWITDPAQRASGTNWTWTIIGGDCDNVLPHPTYALYTGKDSSTATRKGTRTAVALDNTQNPPRYIAKGGSPLQSIYAPGYGNGVAGGQIYPAFGLSGDYLVQGEWDLNGQHYVCTQKVQVRAPGVRAELCWDSVGGQETSNPAGNDIDLHFARLQGTSCGQHGWDTVCPVGGTYQDCWYNPSSGCREGAAGAVPGWGYTASADTACLGWSSRRVKSANGCTNPRLDRDNISCDKDVDDPTNPGFCGPENINLDNPNDGDAFVVGVNHYGNNSGTPAAKSHVNVYCNGERVLSAGYNPVTGQTYPVLTVPGAEATGDWWTVATVKTHVAGGQITGCDVAAVPPHFADPTRDGSNCVDSQSNASSPAYNYKNHAFVDHASLQGVPNGSVPALPGQWCKH